MCRDFLKEIFQKYHQQKEGQANKEVCSVSQKQKKEGECFGAPNVKQPYVLKNVSKHFTPS